MASEHNFRAVVEYDRLGIAAKFGDDIECASHALAGEAEIGLECKVFSRAVVANGENPKAATVPKPIVDKVERPSIVWSESLGFDGSASKGKLAANAFSDLQVRRSIDPRYALVVVEDALSSEQDG
jgi:hypothetical protein